MQQTQNQHNPGDANPPNPIRVWPGVIIVLLQWMFRHLLPVIFPGPTADMIGVFGGFLGGVAVMTWWVFFSRAQRFDRWSAIVVMILALVLTSQIVHVSIRTGNMGMMFFIHAIPILSLAFVVWAVATRYLSTGLRRATMFATILAACGAWMLVRSEGLTTDAGADFVWRWARTPEEKLLARSAKKPLKTQPAAELTNTPTEWPGFRGIGRNALVNGVLFDTDWSGSPPVEIWRQPVGPGCSSFAVHGDLFYTQEQRGEDEVVSCYRVSTGRPVWMHHDKARFWDSHAGAGPRGTPSLSGGYVYTLGATGILNALDALDGSVLWSRNAASDTGVELPGWGLCSSPLIVEDIVLVATAGQLAAYDCYTGDPLWYGPDGGKGYSSPHFLTISGKEQVLLMSEIGITSVQPEDGKVLWKHEWTEERIVQPAVISDGDLLISAGGIKGIRRVAVNHGTQGWSCEERWTSIRLRPNHSDFVVHKGHAYGFDGMSLACIDIENGERQWKGGRYGGQLLLLANQDLLLVLTEKGDVALVAAEPFDLNELSRFPAIKGKTWNHPVLVRDILLVRNAEEMAAFNLPLADSGE